MDDHSIDGIQIGQEGAGDVSKSPRHLMTLDSIAHRFGDDQADPWSGFLGLLRSQAVDDEIGLCCPRPSTDCGTELGRSGHPVLCRKHRVRPGVASRSQ